MGRTARRAHVSYQRAGLDAGDHAGTTVVTAGGSGEAAIRIGAPQGIRAYTDPYADDQHPRRYTYATWVSAIGEPGFGFTELVTSWQAQTPPGCWLEFAARIRSTATAAWSNWLVLARWAEHDTDLHPTSVPGEADPLASVAVDTLCTRQPADAWQLRVTLLRPEGDQHASPLLTRAGVMVSTSGYQPLPPTRPGSATGRILDVPALSQRVHTGHYPHWDGGGDAWCSPTSIAMVLAFWGSTPDPQATEWVDPSYPDPAVYHAVRHCYDHGYAGAGNWSFNTAYAARFGLHSFVTRLRDLTEVERFVHAGIPLIASIGVDPSQLHGADYRSPGHLVVVTGFTPNGDVAVNDPGARDPATVRRRYRRAEFERAWRCTSNGLVYVLHPGSVPLPPPPRRPTEANW